MNMHCKVFSLKKKKKSQYDEMKQQLIQSQRHSIKESGVLNPQKTKTKNTKKRKQRMYKETEFYPYWVCNQI